MRLFQTLSASVQVHFVALLMAMALTLSLTAQTGCLDEDGNFYEPYSVLVVSDDPCENFTCAQTALGFMWLLNEEYLDDCSGEDNDEQEGESNGGDEGGDGGEDDEEEGDDEDVDDEDGDDEDEDGEGDLDELEELIELLTELCGSNEPNDLGIDPDMACGILELIEACNDGSEEACVELESLLEDFFGDDEDEEDGDGEEEEEEDDEEDGDDEDDDEEDGDDEEGDDDDEEDGDEEDDDEEGEGGGEEECLVEFEFEQATDEAGLPLPYNVIVYVDEPEADTYYFWTFGDGMESDEPNPTHVYEEVGNYEVCLTVTQVMGNLFTCTAVYCDTLMIDTDGLVRQQLTLNVLFPGQTLNSVAEQEATLSVFPNPAADAFRIQASAGIESAVVRTLDGRWVGRWVANGQQAMALSCEGWPTGAYVLEVRTAEGVMRSRVLVQH